MKLLPAKKAAEHFNIHTNTLRLWARRGVIKTVEIGAGKHRYDIDSVGQAFLEEKDNGQTSE